MDSGFAYQTTFTCSNCRRLFEWTINSFQDHVYALSLYNTRSFNEGLTQYMYNNAIYLFGWMIENPNSQIKAAITNNLRVREIRGLMEGALVTMTSENVRSLALETYSAPAFDLRKKGKWTSAPPSTGRRKPTQAGQKWVGCRYFPPTALLGRLSRIIVLRS
jgi:hypothetical protein